MASLRLDPFQTVVEIDLIKTMNWEGVVFAEPEPARTETAYNLLIYYKKEEGGRAAVWLDDGPIFFAYHLAMGKFVNIGYFPTPNSWFNNIGEWIRAHITAAMLSKGITGWRWDDSIRPDNYQTHCQLFERYGYVSAANEEYKDKTTCHYSFPGVYRITKDGVKRFTMNYMPLWEASECAKAKLWAEYRKRPSPYWETVTLSIVNSHIAAVGGVWGGGCTNWETTP